MDPHCQICGRSKATLRDGSIARHHFRGSLCLGSYNRPYETGCDGIESAEAHWSRQAARFALRWDQHRAGRRNEPLPTTFWSGWASASGEVLRLRRRLVNWHKRQFARAA